jgi:radical SAM superfamily enzyme YgiQ (UPF0313 family)
MRIVLLYPPPWKVAAPGEHADFGQDGPPEGFRPTDVDRDFFQAPYGLLSLAAQALRAGHQVKVLNLSAFTWTRVQDVLRQLDADLFGLSCYTANRRGVGLVAECIKQHHPDAHVVVGGPHATALPLEMLIHHADIDTVVLGEGEATFVELIDRLVAGGATTDVPGTAGRVDGVPTLAPPRPRIDDLDQLASPHDYFDTYLFMTSRGCPGRCTFCAKNVVWGGKYRTHSVPYVLDTLEAALNRLPIKALMLKDDTFTANRKRALAICEQILERGLRFIWSCDTRVDALDEEVLRAMRLAGCQRLSLGVESGSTEILLNIRKRVTPETILAATAMAKKYGLQVRYFMMLGNRGETAATFRESVDFVERAQPHQSIFACLSVYPGTADFEELERDGVLDREVFFTETFQELKLPFDASEADTELMSAWFFQHLGIQEHYREGTTELRAILDRLGDHHAAHFDLGKAYYRDGQLDLAESHLRRALELGYPVPTLVNNSLACVLAARGDISGAQRELSRAMGGPPFSVVVRNLRAMNAWRTAQAHGEMARLDLSAEHDFELPEPQIQPMLPGPLGDDFADWA